MYNDLGGNQKNWKHIAKYTNIKKSTKLSTVMESDQNLMGKAKGRE